MTSGTRVVTLHSYAAEVTRVGVTNGVDALVPMSSDSCRTARKWSPRVRWAFVHGGLRPFFGVSKKFFGSGYARVRRRGGPAL
jgi:hypothetical protein